MEQVVAVPESAARRALRRLLGKKAAEQVVFDPDKTPDALAAKARLEQLRSGVVPKSGRGSLGGTTPLPEGKCWKPHVGTAQRVRVLKQTWAKLEKLAKRDVWMATTRERLLDAVLDEPQPEFAAMSIALGAKLASDEKKAWLLKNPAPAGVAVSTSWPDAINQALNHWEEVAQKSKEKAVAEGVAL